MSRDGKTILDATREWVKEFNAIPYAICEKLLRLDYDELYEVTPPAVGDTVCVWNDEYNGKYGEIVESKYDGENDLYLIGFPDDTDAVLSRDEFETQPDGVLPMWGTLWSFGDSCDNWWLEDHLQEMADCGFRIYEQEDYGYIFGIDGAGYDFYEAHWIPLYKVRGLHWHDPKAENVA